MEIKTREELIHRWNANIKDYKNKDKKQGAYFKKIKIYLKFIKDNKDKKLPDKMESLISEIEKGRPAEFEKIRNFDEIIKYIKDFENESSSFIKEPDDYDYLFIVLELVHNKLITYDTDEINNILNAYKTIFKTHDDENGKKLKEDLIEYLDLNKERKRDYSVITSNFLIDEAEFIKNLNKENKYYEAKLLESSKALICLSKKRKNEISIKEKTIELTKKEKETPAQEERDFFKEHIQKDLFLHSKKSPIGSSIGIDPLTDDLLLRSFKPGKKDIVIILGKDSYPCFYVSKNVYHSFQPPLYNYSMYNHPKFYKLFGTKKDNKFVIKDLMKKPIFLFLNLYPDFRPEFENTSGGFNPDPEFVKIAKKYELGGDLTKCFDYCVEKFESVMQIIQNNNFTIKAIISLGGDVKDSLVRNGKICNDDYSPVESVELKNIKELRYEDKYKNIDINYIPIYHPSMPSYFTNDYNEKYLEILEKVLSVDSSSVATV
jgi:hypothetical protein